MRPLLIGWYHTRGLTWLIAALGTLLTPWLLIYSRGGADGTFSLIAGLWLLHCARTRSWQWLGDPFMRVAILAWLWLMTTSAFSPIWREALGNAAVWIRLILAVGALSFWVMRERELAKYLMMSQIIMLLFICIDCMWQAKFGVSLSGHPIGNYGRLTGPLDNVKVGIFLAKLALPTLSLYFYFARNKLQIISACAFMLLIYGIVLLSGERTAFVSLTLGLLTCFTLLALARPSVRPALFYLCLAMLVAMEIVLGTQDWVQDRLVYLIAQMGDFANTTYGQLFQIGLRIGRDHWLTGAGQHGFRELCPSYMTGGFYFCSIHPHNPYIEWFAEAGIVGLALFVTMVALLARKAFAAYRASTGQALIFSVAALGALMLNFFPLLATQSQFSNWPGLLFWYAIGLSMSLLNMARE